MRVIKLTQAEAARYWSTRPGDGKNGYVSYTMGTERSEFLVAVFRVHVGFADSIVEVGCNVGRNLYHLHRAGYENLTGIDINRAAIEHGRSLYGMQADLIHASAVDYFKNAGCDVVFSMAALEHINDNDVFEGIAVSAKTIITIEYEEESGSRRIYPRDYAQMFGAYGFNCIESRKISDVAGIEGYTMRVMGRAA